MKRFEGIPVFRLNFSPFTKGAAVTLPCIGIFVGKEFEKDNQLLRHEFGHILQYRKWGFWLFWRRIALTSLKSARWSEKMKFNHQTTWTEWSANRLSYEYFNKPTDWNFNRFPINPTTKTDYSVPKFRTSHQNFQKDWADEDVV